MVGRFFFVPLLGLRRNSNKRIPMPPKFGNYLFRNLKGGQSDTPPDLTNLEAAAELADQTIVLQPGDFVDSDSMGGTLNWSNLDPAEIRVQFKDTQGLME